MIVVRNIKYGFVVLHYIAYETTITCVDTILAKFKKYDIKIVIVDNNSNNDTGRELERHYQAEPRVFVIVSNMNNGFARGNNIGYSYLLENVNPDFITILNNDVIISQNSFLDWINEIYSKTNFAVLGPDIYCPETHTHQNPSRLKPLTPGDVQREVISRERRNRFFIFFYFRGWLFSKVKKNSKVDAKIDTSMQMDDVVLHGACYIFSNEFIEKRNLAFNPRTFLYFEEDILSFECKKAGLKVVYSPRIGVIHLDDVSTNLVFNNGYKKAQMKNYEMLRSAKVLEQVMKCRE